MVENEGQRHKKAQRHIGTKVQSEKNVMKYAIIIPDGVADEPIEQLGGRTILQAAELPNIQQLSRTSRIGLVKTIPDGFNPGSDVAILSVFGYSPIKYYTGRAPLEAAAIGLQTSSDQMIFRCNLVTIVEGVMEDFSAGHISTNEAATLIGYLSEHLGDEKIAFYAGISYRHLMVTDNARQFDRLTTTAPHDIMDQPIRDHLPVGGGSKLLRELMDHSQRLLAGHDVNKVRGDLGENPANSIWLWGQGQQPTVPPFQDRFNLQGAVITAVDLVRGIAKIIGWDTIDVPGATGYIDTNYAGKGQAACKALDEYELVCVHVEATDEAGHNADYQAKLQAVEQIDRHIVGPVLEKLKSFPQWRIMVLPDHPTPVRLRTHTAAAVPFLIAGSEVTAGGAEGFDEDRAARTDLRVDCGWELMEYFLKAKM